MRTLLRLCKISIVVSLVVGGMAVCLAQSQSGGLAGALGSAETRQAMAEAKQIAIACKLYASDHEGRYPAKLEELVPEYLPDKKLIGGYDCLGGIDTEASNTVLLRSKSLTKDGRRVVVHSDASVALVTP